MAFERRLELNKSTEIKKDEQDGDVKPKTTKAIVDKQKPKSNIFNGKKRSNSGGPEQEKKMERSRSETKVERNKKNLAKAEISDDNVVTPAAPDQDMDQDGYQNMPKDNSLAGLEEPASSQRKPRFSL